MHLSVATIAFFAVHLVAGQTSLSTVPSSTALVDSHDENGTSKTLPRGNSTAVATVHKTKTTTSVAFTTVVETLTLLDLGRRTQTNTRTVTSVTGSNQRPTKAPSAHRDVNRGLLRRKPRMHPAIAFAPVSSPERAEGYAVSGLRFMPRQAVVTITTTKTIEITTTVTQTITHTIFTTIISAPRATYTTSTATTIYVPPGAGVTTSAAQPTGGQNVPTGSRDQGQTTQTGPQTPVGVPSSSAIGPSSTESSGIHQSSQSDIPSSSPLPATSTNIETTTTPPSSETASTGAETPSTPLPSSSDTMRGTPGTMLTPTPTSSSTAPPSTPPSALSNEQIVGVIIGSFAFLVFLGIIAFIIRHSVQRHRSKLAQRRQQVTPPSEQGAAAAVAGSGSGLGSALHSNSTAASSGRDPANDVRIVIQQAPVARQQFSHLWPMPPGHAGPGFTTTHVESSTGATTTTTGTTTTGEGMPPVPAPLSLHHHQYQQQPPPQDPGQWSNASEFGSSVSPDGSRAGGGEARYSGAPSSGVFGRGLFSPGQASSAAASPSRPPQARNNGKRGGGLFRSSGGSGWL
ncbi:uncharacterized protein E0L32_004411 [Thyridium curvatum]|uniref:Transmembrane protein n=1 Tax=Thyridium curvatum TaxID=1093900 RepID=A0A507BEP6_9PEZI|nr:uncharacterized protein E0L32_004411 [Thyridium curvatum]TPX15431.1 hypothetical protein E0L32_004411 [Thyridium curvatum]